MGLAVLASTEMLVDERMLRSELIAWAIEHYPVLSTGALDPLCCVPHLDEIFTRDEHIADALIREHFTGSAHCVEPSVMYCLLAERRYGAALYEEAFGQEAVFWRGGPMLEPVEVKAPELGPSTSGRDQPSITFGYNAESPLDTLGLTQCRGHHER